MKKLFAVSLVLLSFAACDRQRAKNDVTFLEEQRPRIDEISKKNFTRWSNEEKALLERYFRLSAYWIFEAQAAKKSLKEFESLMIPQATWKRLNDECRKGEYYRCSDEIRRYQEILPKI